MDPVMRDRGLGHVNAQQSTLILDPWGAPGRVVARHLLDEFSELKRDLRSSGSFRSGQPSPVEREALGVPSDDRLGLDDDERRTPTRPDP